jgi:hypothetical protein
MPDRPFDSLGSLRPRRETDDARLQRLADLSIEIRMLKARALAVMDASPERFGASTHISSAHCPYCGHTAGLALLPREYRRLSTLVRCFGCHRDSSASAWTTAAADDTRQVPERRGAH